MFFQKSFYPEYLPRQELSVDIIKVWGPFGPHFGPSRVKIDSDTEVGQFVDVQELKTIHDGRNTVEPAFTLNNLTGKRTTSRTREQINNINKLVLGQKLKPREKLQLRQLLFKYYDVSEYDVGRTTGATGRIDTGDHPPIKYQPYRLPPTMREVKVLKL